MKSKDFMDTCKDFEGPLKDGCLERQIIMLEDILKGEGIEPVKGEGRRGNMEFYIGEEAVFALRDLPKSRGRAYALIDRSFYNEYLAKDRGTFCFVIRRGKDYKVRVYVEGYRAGIELHQLMMEKERDSLDDRIVDHKFCNALINTSDAVRLATPGQNRRNSKYLSHQLKDLLEQCQCPEDYDRYEKACAEQVDREKEKGGECAYNPLKDFSVTWYAFVMHKMLGWGTARDMEDYNRDYILRNDKVAACYYRNILSP